MLKSKNILLILLISVINVCGFSQTTLWSETFSNVCASGCATYTGPNGAWNMNVSTGTNSGSCNIWYVSCAEEGHVALACGTGCGTPGNSSLHVGDQTFFFDGGAAYDASQTTNRRTESPNINTTAAGANTITLAFTYIGYGEPGRDRCQLLYSINGGAAWLVLENPIPVAVCCPSGPCGGQSQGRWTARSYTLPATCNNITNFRIAFNWINDASSETDPSFAVDYITLQYTAPMPVTWLSFKGYNANNVTSLKWETASETNNDYFEVHQSCDGLEFTNVGKVKGGGNSNKLRSYSYFSSSSESKLSYYKIKQVDYNGDFQYSKTIVINNNDTSNYIFSLQTNLISNSLSVIINAVVQNSCYVEISDISGKKLVVQHIDLLEGDSFFKYNVSFFKPGMYYIVIKDENNQKVIASNKFIKL